MIKNLTKVQKICAKLAVILIIVSLLFGYITNISYASTSYNKFDDINVLDDLKSATIEGKPFVLDDYKPNKNGKLKIIHFAEYCYSYFKNMQANYNLYIYVYNPQQLVINTGNIGNKIQIATEFDDEGKATLYEKFELAYCNKSTDGNYKDVFYKFKVKAPQSLLPVVEGKEMRKYEISGVELVPQDGQVAETAVAHTFTYNGYAKGYGTNQELSTLACSITDLETVELNLQSTQFRTPSSGDGVGYQNQLESVYFSVPEYFSETYGELHKIRASWFEAKTQPIWVLDRSATSTNIKNRMQPYLGVDTGGQNKKIPYAAATEYSYLSTGSGSVESMNIGYNMDLVTKTVWPNTYTKHYKYEQRKMSTIMQIPSGEDLTKYAIPSSVLIDEWARISEKLPDGDLLPGVSNKYAKSIFLDGVVDKGRKYGPQVCDISNKDRINLLSAADTLSTWELLFNYGFSKPTDKSILDQPPIYEIKEDDLKGTNEEIANRLLVGIEKVDKIKEQYLKDKVLNKTTTLFRFAQTKYYSQPASVFEYEDPSMAPLGKSFSYLAQETVFLDFDIIQLGYLRDGKYTNIPVVASPIDIIGGITPPIEWGGEDDCNWWCMLKKILKIIAIVVLILILLPILMPIITLVVKAVCGIVCLPFKAIGSLFKKGGKGGNKTRGEPSGGVKYNADGITVTVSNGAKEKARRRFGKSKAISPKQFEKNKQPSTSVNSTNGADKFE